ncbi:MAG TPA: 8-amino-7-oxononanoate synthase, partial [Egibacteraceae bacterium]|nr:8-amino-7-oxononanoate synthase [Egibacteraceae bacterium]
MPEPLDWVAGELARLEAAGLRRRLRRRSSPAGRTADGLVNLSSNDYLDLAGDPRLAIAAAEAARDWGAGSGASRLVTGTTALHTQLEREIAAWKGTQDAVVFSSGYLANVGTIQALVGRGDTVCSDALNHASIIDGCRLSRADVRVFAHADADALDRALAGAAGRKLVVTDGVFSMDGDAAPLRELCDVAEAHGAMVMVDDAHGCGVTGPDGRGTAAAQGAEHRVHVQLGTLSKAFGAAGGYVAGSAELCDWLRNRARSFVFDTAPPPPVVGAALEGLRVARAEPHRRERATALAQRLAGALRLPSPAAAVVPFVVGTPDAALAAQAELEHAGLLVTAIRPPTVPDGSSRLRFALTAAHTEDDVDRAADVLSGRG